MRIASFDPGKTTGYALGEWDGNKLLIDRKLELRDIPTLWHELNLTEPDVIIYERFVYRGGVSADLSGCRQEGLFDLYDSFNECQLVVQSSTVKRFWSDQLIKHEGFTHPSKHVKDAIRHMLQYLTFDLKVYQLRKPA